MYEDISATARLGLTVIITAVLIGLVLTLMSISSSVLNEGENVLQNEVDYLQQKQPDKTDTTLTYDEYQDKYQNDNWYEEPERHPAEVVESGSFGKYIGLAIFVVGIILAGGKVLVDILYITFPFIFKIKEMEDTEVVTDTEDPYAYMNDDSRYAWADELLKDKET